MGPSYSAVTTFHLLSCLLVGSSCHSSFQIPWSFKKCKFLDATRTLGIYRPWLEYCRPIFCFSFSFLFFKVSKQAYIHMVWNIMPCACVSSFIAQAGFKTFVVFSLFLIMCVCVGVHLSAGAQEEQQDQISMEKVVMSHSMWVLKIELISKNSMSS